MGEVYKVRRKVETRGLHNANTREKASIHKELHALGGAGAGAGAGAGVEGSYSKEEEISLGSIGSKSKSRKQRRWSQKTNEETLKKLELSFDTPNVNVQEVTVTPPPKVVKLKPILKNSLPVPPEHKSPLEDDNDNDNDNDDDDDDDESSSNESPQAPHEHGRLQHKDSRLLRTHFAEDYSSEHDTSTAEGFTEGSDLGSSERERDHTGTKEKSFKKDKRWVPRRTIRFQRLYACKTIRTEHIQEAQLKELLNEIYMMRKMDHPYIIRLYEVYQVKSKFIIWCVCVCVCVCV